MAISEISYASNAGLASDKALRPFLAPSFDPADFLNATLPSWTSTSSSAQQRQTNSASLSEQTQALVSQLTAQLNRLSNTLTQLTDEILRCGSRLAYDVEVLRGDTTSLSDVLAQGLRADIERFAPVSDPDAGDHALGEAEGARHPEYVEKLHTLSLVRGRLEAVIKVFGDAIDWVLPQSELVSKSTFTTGASADANAQEQKGRAFVEKIRLDLSDMIDVGDLQGALRRVEELRALAEVWKGTAEEKSRVAFVEGMAGFVTERRR